MSDQPSLSPFQFKKDDVNMKAMLTLMRQYRGIIILSMVVCVALSMVVLVKVTPRYTTAAYLALDLRESNVVDVESVLSGLPADAAAVESEMEVIKSDSLIGRVVDGLDLMSDPEFNPALRPKRWWSGVFSSLSFVDLETLVRLGLAEHAPPADPEALARQDRDAVIQVVKNKLQVSLVGRSLVIEVGFESVDPSKAAEIANYIADQYLVDQLEARFEATRRASAWLSERLTDLEAEVKEDEAAIEEFRANQTASIGVGSELLMQQVAALNTQLIDARANRAEAQARYDQVASLINSGQGIESAAEVLSSPLIQRLREQESELRREEAELSTRYGDLHPTLINLRAELADLRDAMASEVDKIASSLRNEVDVSQARVVTLEQSLSALESTSIEQGQVEVELRQLEREAEASRLIYENFLKRFKETTDQAEIQEADARIISHAGIPTNPSYPQKTIVLGAGIFLGILMASFIILLIEVGRNSFRSVQELEATLGISVLGIVPHSPMVKKIGRKGIVNVLRDNPTSSLAEAGRTLRTALNLTNVDSPPKVVSISSSVPAEGKSTTSALLALSAASQGSRVLIVDCDMRRPSLHSLFGVNDKTGLVEILAGQVEVDEAIQHVEGSNLDIISAREASSVANALLASANFRTLISTMRERYDLVVLDGAPVLPVSDTLLIGGISDAVIFVVRWNDTPREVASSGLKTLRNANVPLAGTVLSQFDQKAAARFDYANYGYYYNRYGNYYTKD